MKFFFVMLVLFVSFPTFAGQERWQMLIEGHHEYVFGDTRIQGAMHMPWRVELTFTVNDGEVLAANGYAQRIGKATSSSLPEGWVSCELQRGTYLDASLNMRETPRIRFERFPLAGRLENGEVSLQPGYEPPGNYLAVTYRCEAEQEVAENWFAFAQHDRDVQGKRQDSETKVDEGKGLAVIREVKVLPPFDLVRFPLLDGWSFEQGHTEADYHARYALRRVN